MTIPYEIPLDPGPQEFYIQLAGVQYLLTVLWNWPASAWTLDIKAADGTPILLNLPLVPGVDLLGQHQHLGLGGSLFVQTDGDLGRIPQYDDLGGAGHLYFVTP